MKRFIASGVALVFTAGVLASGAWAQGAAAAAKTEPKAATPAPPAAPAKPAEKADKGAKAEKKGGDKLDINTASAADLKGAGFSDAEAKKVIDGRPYKRKDELVNRKIISEGTYKKVKDDIIAHQVKAEKKK